MDSSKREREILSDGSASSQLELLVILGSLTAFAPLSIDMYLPSMPTLEKSFGASTSAVQFTLSTFFFGFALGQSIFGPLTDRFGRKPPLYFSLSLFAISSLGCAWSTSISMLALWRFAQAIGACAGGVVARAMVRDLFPPYETLRIFATLMLVMGVAPMLAPLLGGYILTSLGWEAIFITLAGLGIICLLAVIFRLPETRRGNRDTSLHIVDIARGYKELLADRIFVGNALAGAMSTSGMFAYIATSPFVFITIYNVPADQYGWIFGLNALGLILGSQLNGRVFHRLNFNPKRVHRSASIVQCIVGTVMLASAWTGAGGIFGLVFPLFLYIGCNGLIYPNSTSQAMAPHGNVAGAASALLGTIQFGLAALTTTIITAIPQTTAIPMAFTILVCGLLGSIIERITPEFIASRVDDRRHTPDPVVTSPSD